MKIGVIIACILIMASLCACSTVDKSKDEGSKTVQNLETLDDQNNERTEDILTAIMNKDKEALVGMFSEQVQDEADLDTDVDKLFNYFDGKIISIKYESTEGETYTTDEKESKLESFDCHIATKTENYLLTIDDYTKNDIDPKKKGLYLITVMRAEDKSEVYDENGGYVYENGGYKIDHEGIYIPIP